MHTVVDVNLVESCKGAVHILRQKIVQQKDFEYNENVDRIDLNLSKVKNMHLGPNK